MPLTFVALAVLYATQVGNKTDEMVVEWKKLLKKGIEVDIAALDNSPAFSRKEIASATVGRHEELALELITFFADRLKVTLKDQGKRHDLVDAVFALGDDDLVRIVARVEALDGFLKTDDGKNLQAGYKRASNILKAEEKKGWKAQGGREILPDASAPEVQLHDALRMIEKPLADALKAEDFLERRLQTLVYKLGLAKSIHHARVLIRQRHIRVGKQIHASKINEKITEKIDKSIKVEDE